VERLHGELPLAAVVLFGSRARGEHTQHSDYDLAVVSTDFSGEPRMYRRTERLFEALRGIGRIDPVGLAPGELLALDCLLVLDVVADGIPLHDDGCFARARSLLEQRTASGLVERITGGWRIEPVS
jgi:hypothetical protein